MTMIKKALTSAVENRWVKLLVALTLFFTAGLEVWDGLEELKLGAHHGVLLYSLFSILKELPHFFDATEILAGEK